MVLLVLLYTTLLIYLGRLGRRKAPACDFIMGGRQFTATKVFFMISALWCSWIFVVEIESAYLFGISAVWFGVSVGVLAVTGGFLLRTPFAKLSYVTSSRLLGDRFGTLAGTLSGLILSITFPIFAMSNVLAAAEFIHAVTGWAYLVTLVGTVSVIMTYILGGGIWALAYAQIANFIIISIGLLVGTAAALHAVPLAVLAVRLRPEYLKWDGVGIPMILAWLFSALLGVVSAQAEFQILMAASDHRAARSGLRWAMVSVCVFAILSAVIGLCVRAGTGYHNPYAVIASPEFFMRYAPWGVVMAMAMAVWCSALAWSAPLMFSGASSLGVDVIRPILGERFGDATKRCVQICLPVQAVLVVLYALVRPDHLAWWQMFSLTIRNGAMFAPTVALLVWPVAQRGAAVTAMILGSGSGLLWNIMGRFSTEHFVLGIDPLWIAAIAGILSLVLITLLTGLRVHKLVVSAVNCPWGWASVVALIGSGALVVGGWGPRSLMGPLVLTMALSVLGVCALVVRAE
ncbi:MAG: sodium:solute symporter family protein [Acidiferrobacterales bacterium]